MLTSYPIACPNPACNWTGNVVPSHIRGGSGVEIASRQQAWFRCPHCQVHWEVEINSDKVLVSPPAVENNSDKVLVSPPASEK